MGGRKLSYPTGKTYQFYGHDGLVVVGEFVVHRHDHAVCHDGDDDDPVEGRPVDQPGHHLPHWAGGSEEEERGWTSLVRLVLLLLPHPERSADLGPAGQRYSPLVRSEQPLLIVERGEVREREREIIKYLFWLRLWL